MSPEHNSVIPNSPKLNLGWYEFQKMGRIGSTEMYLIWANFGITEMCSGLIDITGSRIKDNLEYEHAGFTAWRCDSTFF